MYRIKQTRNQTTPKPTINSFQNPQHMIPDNKAISNIPKVHHKQIISIRNQNNNRNLNLNLNVNKKQMVNGKNLEGINVMKKNNFVNVGNIGQRNTKYLGGVGMKDGRDGREKGNGFGVRQMSRNNKRPISRTNINTNNTKHPNKEIPPQLPQISTKPKPNQPHSTATVIQKTLFPIDPKINISIIAAIQTKDEKQNIKINTSTLNKIAQTTNINIDIGCNDQKINKNERRDCIEDNICRVDEGRKQGEQGRKGKQGKQGIQGKEEIQGNIGQPHQPHIRPPHLNSHHRPIQNRHIHQNNSNNSAQSKQPIQTDNTSQSNQIQGLLYTNNPLAHFQFSDLIMDLQINKILKTSFLSLLNGRQIQAKKQQLQRINTAYVGAKEAGSRLVAGLANFRIELFNQIGQLIVQSQLKGESNPSFVMMQAQPHSNIVPEVKLTTGIPRNKITTHIRLKPNPSQNHPVQCSICLQNISSSRSPDSCYTLACNHSFHRQCCEDWLQLNGSCPMCRTNLKI